jgi:pimeloyl-ACP methyl ester carboxylesterase
LAATLRDVDFVVASYSLAVSPVGEDRDEAAQSVSEFGPAAVGGAEALHRAATRVVVSRFAAGMDELERLKARYRAEPWFAKVGGDYTGPLVATPAAEMGKVRALFDTYLAGIDLQYDPEPALEHARAPTLFILAGEDTEAPHEATEAVLRRLQAAGAPIDVAVFPHADHGLIAVDGPLEAHKYLGRLAPGYLDLLADWISHRRFRGPYGAAELFPRR